MPLLLLIFIAVPIAEIYVFIQVGSIIGTWYTIGLVIITAIIGTSLLRWQGYGVLRRTQDTLQKGDLPVDSVIDGVFLIVAGVLLLTPGLLTDTVGFLLFVPLIRRVVATYLFKKFVAKAHVDVRMHHSHNQHGNDPYYHQKRDNIIDVEFSEVDKKNDEDSDSDKPEIKPNPNSPWKNTP